MSQFDLLFAAMGELPNSTGLIDSAGKIVFLNPVFKNTLREFSKSEDEIKNFDDLSIRAASFGKAIDIEEYKKNRSESGHYELNVNLFETSDLVFKMRLADVDFENCNLTLITLNDITTQWNLEKKIALRDSITERVISEFPAMICGMDHDGFIKIWNHRAAELTGYTAAEMIDNPKALANLFPNSRYRYEILEKWNSREENVIRNWDIEITRKDGTTKIISWTVRYRENSIIEGVNNWALGIDVTAERKILNALKLSEEKFRIISKTTNDALWEFDLVEGKLIWSEGITESFGYNLDDVEQSLKWWEERIHPDYKEIVSKRFSDFIQHGGHFWSDEYQFRKSDNTYAFVLDQGYILRDSSGIPVKAIGGMTDLSNEKNLAELTQFRENQLKNLINKNSDRIKSPLSKVMQISKLLSIMKHERQDVKDLTDQLLRAAHDLEVAVGNGDDDDDDE